MKCNGIYINTFIAFYYKFFVSKAEIFGCAACKGPLIVKVSEFEEFWMPSRELSQIATIPRTVMKVTLTNSTQI